MKKLIQFLLLCIITLSLTACSKAKSFYNNYVNPPATLNYKIVYPSSEKEDFLSDNLLLISEELASFEKDFDVLAQPPIAEDLDALFSKYTWLQGIILLHPSGQAAAAVPEFFPPFDFTKILEVPKKSDERAIRAYFDQEYLILAKPVFDTDDSFMGLTLIYFDFNRLAAKFPSFSKDIVVIAANSNSIITSHSLINTFLENKNWQKIAKSSSRGTITDKPNKAHWLVRYFYDYPLLFLIEE